MSVHVSAYVWEHSQQKGTGLLLLLAIADIAHRNGVAFPSVATLARFIRMSERNTQRVVAMLERSGELEVKRNGGPHGTHLYRVKMNMTLPLFEGGDKLSPDKMAGDNAAQKGVTNPTTKGDTATSPEPKELKTEPKEGAATRRTRLPADFKISDNVRKWYAEKGYPGALIEQHFETFIRKVEANGSKYADWDRALENAIADDWGEVRREFMRVNGQRGAPTHAASEWWKSADGLAAMAKKLGVERRDMVPPPGGRDYVAGEQNQWFKARVCAAAGDGPWCNDKDEFFQRFLKAAREQLEKEHA